MHSGFFTSAKSINRRLKELLVSACAGTPGEWDLLITGHSLGGALASLIAPDLVGKVDTTRGFKERDDTSWWGQAQRLGKQLTESAKEVVYGELPRLRKVQMYTFGAPRVGNSQFAAYFNEVFDGREAFRIVNDADIVPRLPRGGNAAGLVLDYDHVGRTGEQHHRRAHTRQQHHRRTHARQQHHRRTHAHLQCASPSHRPPTPPPSVLIAEGTTVAKGFDGFWVEGTSDDADCPLRGVSPLSNPFSSGQLLGDAGQQARQLASGAWSKIDAAAKEKSRSQLFKAVGEVTSDLGRARDSVVSRVSSMNPLEAVSLIGLDKQFVESELQLIDSIAKGTALVHHLEPSYFLAMTRALDAALGEAPGGMPDVEAEA